MQEKMPVPILSGLALCSVNPAFDNELTNFPCGRHQGTIAARPNPNAFLTFRFLTRRQGEKDWLEKIPWTDSQEARRISASFFERPKALGVEELLESTNMDSGPLGTACGLLSPLYAPVESPEVHSMLAVLFWKQWRQWQVFGLLWPCHVTLSITEPCIFSPVQWRGWAAWSLVSFWMSISYYSYYSMN